MPPIGIRFGGYQPPQSVHSRAAEVFGKALLARAGDDVKFELKANIVEEGYKAADLLAWVERGELTLCYFSASYLAERVMEFALLDLPFSFATRQRAYAVLDGDPGAILADKLQASTGYRLLGWWDNGFRHISNKRHPIRTPADCRGLRIRTLFSDLHQRVFAQLGFEPVPLDVKDLLTAVRDNTIDAQENPLTNYYHFNIHQQHRYLTLSGHFFGAAVLLCHSGSFHAWPEQLKQAVQAAAAEATQAQRGFAAAEDGAILTKLESADVEITRLRDSERKQFADALAALVSEQKNLFGEALSACLKPAD